MTCSKKLKFRFWEILIFCSILVSFFKIKSVYAFKFKYFYIFMIIGSEFEPRWLWKTTFVMKFIFKCFCATFAKEIFLMVFHLFFKPEMITSGYDGIKNEVFLFWRTPLLNFCEPIAPVWFQDYFERLAALRGAGECKVQNKKESAFYE